MTNPCSTNSIAFSTVALFIWMSNLTLIGQITCLKITQEISIRQQKKQENRWAEKRGKITPSGPRSHTLNSHTRNERERERERESECVAPNLDISLTHTHARTLHWIALSPMASASLQWIFTLLIILVIFQCVFVMFYYTADIHLSRWALLSRYFIIIK